MMYNGVELKVKDMSGIQKIAYKNTKKAFEFEVGGWYNCTLDYSKDECREYIPETEEDAKDYIYDEALNNLYGAGFCGYGDAPKEMRFAGEGFIRQAIDWLFDTDEDVDVIAEVMNWR